MSDSPEFVEKARRKVLFEKMLTNTSAAKDLDELREKLAHVIEKQKILYEDRLEGRVTTKQWTRFNGDLVSREEDLARKIETEEKSLLAKGTGGENVGQILEVMRDFGRVFESLDQPRKKRLIQAIVHEVRIDRDEDQTSRISFLPPWDQLAGADVENPEPPATGARSSGTTSMPASWRSGSSIRTRAESRS